MSGPVIALLSLLRAFATSTADEHPAAIVFAAIRLVTLE